MTVQRFGFVGLGLIGGSIAKAIRKQIPDAYIIAYDIDVSSLKISKEEGICDETAFDITKLFYSCDIIFLCTPVSFNNEYLAKLKAVMNENAIITDVGSVKNTMMQSVMENQMEHCFIGGHPMAGSEKSGFVSSDSKFLENAFYILTPTDKVSDDKINALSSLIKTLGSIPIVINSQTHDHITAAISHLPHMIAYSLVNLIKKSDDSKEHMKLIAAGGFKDITRIASSSPVMWQQICEENKDELLSMMNAYTDEFESIKKAIIDDDYARLHDYFSDARDYRNSFQTVSSGPIPVSYVVSISIPDETGMIAKISGLFAKENINIKNIGIVHNREYEEGALRIEFYDKDASRNAVQVLQENHYRIFTK